MDVAVPTLDPMVPVPTLGDVIMDKVYNDETHEDVLFIFNPPSDIVTTADKSGVAFDVVSDSNVDANKSAEYSRTPAEDPSTPNKPRDNASKIDHDKDRSKPKAFSTGYSTDDTSGAHKLVLCQWPYFKAMFEGDFAEGGAGNKIIRITDASPKAFQMLLRFIYTGKIPQDAKPTTVFMNPLNSHRDASWESLYLLAHRYDIQESVDYVPQCYRFPDLREPVIQYAAQSCRSTLASKSAHAKYLDHPESEGLFGDLLEQMYVTNR